MPQFINHHIFHGHKKLHYTEMNELYITLSLRALALGVGGIFVPLFLYDIGYTLSMIAGFYIFTMVIRVPMELVAAKLITSLGAKHTLTISYSSLFLHFLTLYSLQFFPWLWPLAGAFLAGEMAFFWMSYHLQASSVRTRKKASSQISMTIVLSRMFMALGPLIGGVVAVSYGVEYTLLLAALLLVTASYPLFKTPDVSLKAKLRTREIKFDFFGRDSLAHLAHQINNVVATYLWPLWLLFVLGDYSQIGFIIALSIILGLGLTLWVGRLGDSGHNDMLLKVGTGIKSISHWLRVFSDSFGLAFLTNWLSDIGDNFATGPYMEKFYEAADEGKRFEYILQMNVLSAVGKMLGWVVLLLLTLYLADLAAMQAMFIFAGVSVLAIVWVSRRNLSATS